MSNGTAPAAGTKSTPLGKKIWACAITFGLIGQIAWVVENMFFVGFATAQKLRSAGISTIGDLASASDIRLESLLGKQGPLLIKYASGRDDSPVSLSGERDRIKSVGNGITFSRDLKSSEDALTAVTSLSDTVAGRLRKYGFKAKGVKVDIKDASFKSISRQKQLVKPTHLSSDIKQAAMELISSSWRFPDPIRLITVTAINLTDGEEGELVITTLAKRAMPILRYRTHDITSIMSEKCACGRTVRRIRRIGRRSDDMFIIRGVNVFPSQIEVALMRVEECTPHYHIILEREKDLDTVTVEVEVNDDCYIDSIAQMDALRKKIQTSISNITGIRMTVKIVEPNSIPRSEGKAKRVIDKRKI